MRIGLPVIFLLIASAILAAVHWSALMLNLYWQYLWLDIPMHILGGAVVALIPFALHSLRIYIPTSLMAVLFLVLFFGVVWEVFEYVSGATFAVNYSLDTVFDLLMDLLGGVIGYVVGSRTQNF